MSAVHEGKAAARRIEDTPTLLHEVGSDTAPHAPRFAYGRQSLRHLGTQHWIPRQPQRRKARIGKAREKEAEAHRIGRTRGLRDVDGMCLAAVPRVGGGPQVACYIAEAVQPGVPSFPRYAAPP
jgi:hypothetical protein